MFRIPKFCCYFENIWNLQKVAHFSSFVLFFKIVHDLKKFYQILKKVCILKKKGKYEIKETIRERKNQPQLCNLI